MTWISENRIPEFSRRRLAQYHPVVVVILAFVSLSACETALEPFAESDLNFTLLGFLDTDADTQFVRVVPLRPAVDRISDERLDASVRSVDQTAGETVTWTDSLVSFPDSTHGHVFWATFRAIPEHRYRFEVEARDGSMTWAETTVPPRPGNPDSVYGVLNERADFALIYWPGVEQVIDADVLYDAAQQGCFGKKGDGAGKTALPRIRHRIRYEGDERGVLTGGDTWRFEFDLWRDRDIMKGVFGADEPFCMNLYRLQVRLASPSDEFDPPGGIWDRELLIQPGTISNVTGGLGFVGSVARNSVDWNLSIVAQNSLGYFGEAPPDGR